MTENEMRVRLAEAMGWTDIQTSKISGQVTGIDLDGNAGTIPSPLDNDSDAAALEVWCVTTRPWCAGLTIIVDPRWVEVCVDTYEGDPDAESVVVHQDAEPDPRQRRRSAVCWAIAYALEDPEAGGVK